jgi:hypothetical protein
MIYSSNAFQLVMAKTTVLTSLLFDGTGPGDGGIFAPIMAQITTLAKDLWGVIIGLIVIGAALAMILSVLRGTGGMLIGGSKETTVAVISIVGVVLLVVVAFVAIPQLASLMKSLTPAPPF